MKQLNNLKELLSMGRYRLGDEKDCQEDIEAFFVKNNVKYEKEFKLDFGIVDFFFPNSGLALEIKVSKSWNKLTVYRQCERYCKDSRVKGILLATGSAQKLPAEINGKPSLVYLLSESAL